MPAIPGVILGSDPDDLDRNPCTFKKVCRGCTLCDPERRPTACVGLNCEYYTPCKKCTRNLPVNADKLCTFCDAPEPPVMVHKTIQKMEDHERVIGQELEELSSGTSSATATDLEEFSKRQYDITIPGKAPAQYTPSEKEYYDFQWTQYKGFYRDPTTYAILHNILLLEVELNWVNAFMLNKRGSIIKDIEVKQQRLISNLKTLRDQLPEKDANDLSDDEKSIGMIYQRYCEEIKARKVGTVSRLLTPEAQVLADNLHFKVDMMGLCKRMGYQIVSISDAMDKFINPKNVPEDPADFLAFAGFHMLEKFASTEGAVIDAIEDGTLLGTPEPENFLVESSPSGTQVGFDPTESPMGPSIGESLAGDDDMRDWQ